jgi:hypothetical protein
MTEIRGVAPEKRWTPNHTSPVLETLRHLRSALIEVRGSPVLPARQVKHIQASIGHIEAITNGDDTTHPLTCVDSSNDDDDGQQQNSRRTEHVDTNTPIRSRDLRADIAAMRRGKPKPPPATADEIAWALLRSKKGAR